MFIFQFEYQQAQLEAEIENLSWKVNIYAFFISVFCIFVFYICVFVFGSIWCLKYFQYVILGGTCRDNRQRRLGKSVSY